MIFTLILTRRQTIKVPWNRQLLIIILAGIFDTAGNILFALASSLGRLDISTTLTSLYPAGTISLPGLFSESAWLRGSGSALRLLSSHSS